MGVLLLAMTIAVVPVALYFALPRDSAVRHLPVVAIVVGVLLWALLVVAVGSIGS